MPKTSKKKTLSRHDPLSVSIRKSQIAGPSKRKRKGNHEDVDSDGEENPFIPEKISKKIFEVAREFEDEMDDAATDEEAEEANLEFSDTASMKSQFTDFLDMPDMEAIDPDDEQLLNDMMGCSSIQTRSLADIIMEKIREKEQKKDGVATEPEQPPSKFDKKVVRVYQAVGRMLAKYRSGKVPKALKILPNLMHWEELILLTRPHNWSPHAMYAATRVFSTTLNEMMTQRFYNAVLLPSVREWMKRNRELNPYFYMAIRKAIFRQKAFIKGFLLPLCEAGDCSLREAFIIGSVIQKVSIQAVNASVAMAKIALMPYSGACSLFLRVFLDKQYQLPLGCLDCLVQHFGSFLNEHRTDSLPVLWHQSVLTFAQRYKNDLTMPQIELIRKVINKHNHYLITPEIRRELQPLLNKTNAKRTGKQTGRC
eukprot:NODE_1541_length_1467_cov_139.528358_g1461_i0.p1 GENE.NODE_1541_length_1467_cov_139.528358_g1461_i0~~NODE_1541_length_1467_cov_139.528358_g1461_i0.p1  ORF type:complete len:424 (-),score=115.17 NODE_1541_length_1467_cov_139.528358_g1461_i0:116-1387(-)